MAEAQAEVGAVPVAGICGPGPDCEGGGHGGGWVTGAREERPVRADSGSLEDDATLASYSPSCPCWKVHKTFPVEGSLQWACLALAGNRTSTPWLCSWLTDTRLCLKSGEWRPLRCPEGRAGQGREVVPLASELCPGRAPLTVTG
jgi:hypothetical protein